MLAAAAAYVTKHAPAAAETRRAARRLPARRPDPAPRPAVAPALLAPAPAALALPARPRRTAGELATLAADAAVRPFGAALSERQRLALHLAVREEVLKAVRS